MATLAPARSRGGAAPWTQRYGRRRVSSPGSRSTLPPPAGPAPPPTGAPPTSHPHVAVAVGHDPDVDRLDAVRAQEVVGVEDVVGIDDDRHPDPEVEHARHLVVVDVAEALDLAEDLGYVPGVAVEDGVTRRRQD